MKDPILQIYLPTFMLVFVGLTFFWGWLRKAISLKEYAQATTITQYNRLKRIDAIFRFIFAVFGLMTIIYSTLPELYYIFIPFDIFHHPIINGLGLLILKVAVAWIVAAQIQIDKELYKYSRDMSDLKAMELLYYSETILLKGMLIMFIGMFVTITNLVGILLGVLAFCYLLKITGKTGSTIMD